MGKYHPPKAAYSRYGSKPKDMVRLGIYVMPDLRDSARTTAHANNQTLEAWVTEAIKAKLAS